MKQISNLVAILALTILACACAKETGINEIQTQKFAGSDLILAVNIQDVVKTTLGEKSDEKYPLYWNNGDILYLNGVASQPLSDVAPESKTAYFSFAGEFTSPFVLTYCGKEGAPNEVVFKEQQNYVANSFDTSTAPLYGIATAGEGDPNVLQSTLQSINAAFAFKYKSETVKIKSITVTAENGEKIAGTFTIGENATLTPAAGATSSIVLDAGDNAVDISGVGKPFFVVLPAGTYAKGFSVVVEGEDGSSQTFAIGSSNGITLAAGKVYELSSAPYIYKTKLFGSKTWFVENCRDSVGVNDKTKKLGRSINEFEIATSQYAKINELKPHTGRYYTWYEMMTGIGGCTEAQRAEFIAAKNGIDDMGNSFALDGTVNEYNVQLRGVCPEGWHVPNCNDWWDLFATIEEEYCDVREAGSVARGVEGFSFVYTGFPKYSTPIAPVTKDQFYSASVALMISNVGNLGAYLRGGKKEEGLWKYSAEAYGWPNNDHMHSVYYTPKKNGPVEFDWYPCSYVKYDGTFTTGDLGKQGIFWLGFTTGAKDNVAKAFRIKSDGHQFTQVVTGDATFNAKSGRVNVRCVKNY